MSDEPEPPDINVFDPKSLCPISKDLIEDCHFDVQKFLQDEIAYATGAKERPPRVERVIDPVEPTLVFADAESALRALLDSGVEAYSVMYDDCVCFHCGCELHYESHRSDCSYVAAKALLDKLGSTE